MRLPAPPGSLVTRPAARPSAEVYAAWSWSEVMRSRRLLRLARAVIRRRAMPVFQNILQAIGNTPLVRLNKVAGPEDAAVYAKCEYMNPGGAIKDRMALYILDKAERDGRIKPGSTIVENTSGNTGMGV